MCKYLSICALAVLRLRNQCTFGRGRFASRAACCGVIVAAFAIAPITAQDQFTRVFGPQDQEVPLPQFRPATGQKDAAAIQEIQAFMKAVGATTWTGIQATGTFTAATNQQANVSATVTISGADDFRLDLTSSTGTRSIRIHGPYETILEPNGKRHSVPFLAAKAGYVAFPKLLSSALLAASTSVFDDGVVTISGESLRRITIEQPVFTSEAKTNSNSTSVIDSWNDNRKQEYFNI